MIHRNYRSNTFLILALWLFCANLLSAQFKDISPVIARVGEDSITVEQFVSLFELNPRIKNSNSAGLNAARIDFLHTLIGNKLWSQYRKDMGVDTTLAERTAENELRMMFTLDYLYRKKVLEQAEPTEEELQAAYRKATKTLLVNYLYTESEEEINNLYGLLKQGFNFEEILAARNEKEAQQEGIRIDFGVYEKEIEDEIYGLDVKKYSQPIHLDDGYYIFYLSNILSKYFIDDYSQKEELEKVKEVLLRRNEDETYNSFMKHVLSGKEVVVKKSLRDNLIEQFDKREQNHLFNEIVNDSTYVITSTDILKIENSLGKNVLNNILIEIGTVKVSFQNFIRSLAFTHSKIVFYKNSSRKFIETILSDYINKKILYEEAKKINFNIAEEVNSDMKLWNEYFSFESLRSSISDTVNITDEMIVDTGRKIYQNYSDSSFFQDKKLRQLIRNQLMNNAVMNALKYKTSELAKRTTIKINYVLVQGLETSSINSFAIRRLGFGGTLPSVPIYFPNFQWVNPENYKQFILP